MLETIEMIEKFLRAENAREWSLLQGFLHTDIEYEVVGSNQIICGKEAYINHMKHVYSELPDWKFDIIHIVGNSRAVFVEFDGAGHFTGTYDSRNYQDIPLRLRAVCIFEIQHGLIVREREYFDYKSYEQQLLT